jgi:hypothetical protein
MKYVRCSRQEEIANRVLAQEEAGGCIAWLVGNYREVGKEHRHAPEMYQPLLYPTIKALLAVTALRFKEEPD